MNVIIVDTSVWIEYFKGKPYPEIDEALKEARVYMPPLVISELMSAEMTNSDRQKLSDFLNELFLCECSFEHWKQVGVTRHKLSRIGLNVSTPDIHIAQCALDLKATLLSNDLIFKKIASKIALHIG